MKTTSHIASSVIGMPRYHLEQLYCFKRLLLNMFFELTHLKCMILITLKHKLDLFRSMLIFRSRISLLINWVMKVCNGRISGKQTV